MLEYLSEEWLEAADGALVASGLCAPAGERFTVEQRVGETVFHIVFAGDGVRIRPGPAENPVVTFQQSRDTAVAIALGELASEEAVLNGQTELEGDPMALVANHQVLAKAADVFADLRARTDWGR